MLAQWRGTARAKDHQELDTFQLCRALLENGIVLPFSHNAEKAFVLMSEEIIQICVRSYYRFVVVVVVEE